jgi:DNA replication licensing factor MCM5
VKHELTSQTIAKHVMNIHMNRQNENEAVGEIDIEKMKRYISYCKS